MTHITCTYPSVSMGANMTVHVLLPKEKPEVLAPVNKETPEFPFPVLYLFHGAFDDGETWIQNTNIATLVDNYNIAVVLPSVGNTFYIDSPKGQKVSEFVANELFEYMQEILPLSKDPAKNFVGGCSMGGYGAFYTMLKKPGQFKKAFSLSGALDIKGASLFVKYCGGFLPENLLEHKKLPDSEWDLKKLILEKSDCFWGSTPFLMVCGDMDPMTDVNQAFANALEEAKLLDEYRIYPGDHSWSFWNEHLEECIKWMLG